MSKQAGVELNQAIKRSLFGKYSLYAFQIFFHGVASKVVCPGDFGYVAIVQVFITLIVLVSSTSIIPAVVYLDSGHCQSAQWPDVIKFTDGIVVFGLEFFCISSCLLFDWNERRSLCGALCCCLGVFCLPDNISISITAAWQQIILVARAEIYAEVVSFLICLLMYYVSSGFYALLVKVCSPFVFRFIFYYDMSASTDSRTPRVRS